MSDLPRVRAYKDDVPAVCSKLGCNSIEFKTDLGVGPVFWFGGNGPEFLQFGRDDNGPRLTTGTVICTRCGVEHGIYAQLPEPPQSGMLGGG